MPFSASSSNTSAIEIERYGGKDKKPTELADWAEFHECTDVTVGKWINISDTKDCGKEKCGKVTTRTVTYPVGPPCNGTYPFAAIFYEWTAHNNQRINASADPNTVTDTFNATWTSPDNTIHFTFNISVPVVRPDHEETVFERWSPDFPTIGEWKQKLVPPSSDPTFDFSGETVGEAIAGVGQDSCWSDKSRYDPFIWLTGGTAPVLPGNVWKPDQVGWMPDAVTYYRNPTPPPDPPPPSPVPCGNTLLQQMTIIAPSDTSTIPNNYGKVNVLGGKIKKKEVTSERTGKSETEVWPR